MPAERIFAYAARGHAHYWCSQECLDNDCEFGPCCEMSEQVPVDRSERARYSCNNFVDSGEWLYPHHLQGVWEHRIGPICATCGWTENCHHQWHRTGSVRVLGPGWACRRCGRTAYDKNGRCTEETVPIDYPPCGTWQSIDND